MAQLSFVDDWAWPVDSGPRSVSQVAERALKGATVVVVGATGGLGSALSLELAGRGARVALVGRDLTKLEALAGRLGGSAMAAVGVDLREPTAGDRVLDALGASTRLDGVVHAAGVVAFGDLEETDDTVMEELFLTNVLGPLWFTKRILPRLEVSRGFVVNISAVVAENPLPGMALYSASKAALSAASRASHRELRRRGILVMDVRPPHTETGLAGRPLAGRAPRLPEGCSPQAVAAKVVEAIESNRSEVPADAFVA